MSALVCVSLAEAFKEICPAGHGYTYSSSDIRLSMRKAEAEELPFSSEEQGESSDRMPNGAVKRQQLQEALSGGVTGTLLRAGTSAAEGRLGCNAPLVAATHTGAQQEGMNSPFHPLYLCDCA